MRWSPEEYPDHWERYEPPEQRDAVRVANRPVDDEGYPEAQALHIAEGQGTPTQEDLQNPKDRWLENETADEEDPNPDDSRDESSNASPNNANLPSPPQHPERRHRDD